jgi:hypothetical protein
VERKIQLAAKNSKKAREGLLNEGSDGGLERAPGQGFYGRFMKRFWNAISLFMLVLGGVIQSSNA